MLTTVPVNLTGVGEAVRLPTANVTPDFFTVLRVTTAMGRDFREEEAQAPVVLLRDGIWRSRFHSDIAPGKRSCSRSNRTTPRP